MIKIVNTTEARNNFAQILEHAYYKKDSYVVQRRGRPYALVIGLSDYNKVMKIARQLDRET
ncbi:MAG: type II toxin-antitoxin system prevent-host-death family antitoxin [Candidatus Lokiarchaeota archaeon]|nr:type II toxin-antitoxin system prevent-host-death family antitoxin [Candidatus Lokiarchaeota archaeon]